MSTERRDYYVYVHRDAIRNIFYIGRGNGRCAWSVDPHPVWKKYISERLGGR